MANVKVIFGSTTGATESAAAEIAAAFGVQAINVANATADDFKADLLILGSSTWGLGELQDDWAAKIGLLEQADLKGKLVAVFGLGDQRRLGRSAETAHRLPLPLLISGGKLRNVDAVDHLRRMPARFLSRKEKLLGISKNSIGWIFSVWAKRPMQEELSVAA
jgi:sulfite reductase alpha subunit-like flavoprotein